MVELYRLVAVSNFEELRAEQNVELARSLSNTLIDDVSALRSIAAKSSWEQLRGSPEIDALTGKIDREVKNLSIYVVNVFAPDGLMLYSTDRERIGAKMLMNEGVETAAQGKITSAIVRRGTYNEFDRVVEDRDMIETYVPLINDAGEVVGIFEIHADITAFFTRIDAAQRKVAIGVALGMAFLYVLSTAMFWYSERRLFGGAIGAGWRSKGGQAQAADAAKSEFVATISHEIRTPLNAVLGMTDLLNLTSLTRKQREYINTIQSSGDMLISLVDNLLDFSHLEIGDLELETSEFDVVDLVERVLHIMGHSAYAKGLELVGDFRHDLDLRVATDKRRLQQILVNVITNAVKFTESGEVVVVADAKRLEDGQLSLLFEVTDTGIGIDENTRERLFAAFASGARPASTQPYGSGLGLTISRRLLDNMGGDIGISSRGEGHGTVVSINVPVKQVVSPNSDDLVGQRDGWPARVLSLHANKSAAQSVCRLLGKWQMECETVFDVQEAIHRLRVAASGGKPFGCAIIDSAVTPSDRLLVVRKIRKSPEIANLPVVLLTSISEPLGVGEVSALGLVRCVNKPLLPLELRYNLLRSVHEERDGVADTQGVTQADLDAGELRILIAEDNPVSSGVLQSMLRAEGHGADVVDNGPAVLDALQQRKYDLLLLDCQMPGMDGDVVAQKIQESPEIYGQKPVIVAVTADTTEAHRTQCLAAGMDDFVPKPIRLEGLRGGLVRWIAMIADRNAADKSTALSSLRDNLVERTGRDDESFLNDYIDLFLNDAEERLAFMSKEFVSGNVEELRRAGHALKGACLELGADRMARFCDDLSVAAKNGNLDEVAVVIGKLDREFARLRPVYESAQVSSTSPS